MSVKPARTYSTRFPATEAPISEGGNWISGGAVGLDWGDVLTVPGLAIGRDGPHKYSDPAALLTGEWGPDQTVRATVYSVNQTEKQWQEVEIHLRSTLSAHKCTGYEILFRCLKSENAYMEVVKWNGPVADFTYLSRNRGSQYGVANGDLIEASVVGNVIKVSINGKLMDSVKDDTFTSGNPGIGFNYGCGDTYGDFGLTSLMVSDGPSLK
jgi:hypothetical protein